MLSVYEYEVNDINEAIVEQVEVNLFGSSRLGTKKCSHIVKIDSAGGPTTYPTVRTEEHIIGQKFFELSNHLGNVLATVTDKKVGQDTSSDGMADYYMARTETATLYYDFGWQLPGRQVNPNEARHTFNGKELDRECGIQDYGFKWKYTSNRKR